MIRKFQSAAVVNRRPQLKIMAVFLLLSSLGAPVAFASNEYIQESAAATTIDKSITDNTLRPVPSVTWTSFDVRKAYNVQKRVVASRLSQGERIAGYKAGLTSKGSAEKFSLKAPVTGVLFKSSQLSTLKSLSLQGAYRLMVEQEIAFLLAQGIDKKIPDIASLKGHSRSGFCLASNRGGYHRQQCRQSLLPCGAMAECAGEYQYAKGKP